MYSEMNFRDATVADLPAIVAIYNSTVPSRLVTADTEPVSVESRLPWFRDHSPERRPLLVIEDHGRVAAWLSFQSFYGRPAYDATVEISVYVSEVYRRRGLGTQLVTEAIGRGPRVGASTLLGFIFGHNEPSLCLFEGLGFERWALLPGIAKLEGVDRDLIITGRRL